MKVRWAALLAVLFAAGCTAGYLLFGAQTVQLWIASATLPLTLAFIWLYAADGWHHTWFGRSLMLLALSVLAYTMAVILFRTLGPSYWGRSFLLIFATGGTFVAMLIRTIVLYHVKNASPRH